MGNDYPTSLAFEKRCRSLRTSHNAKIGKRQRLRLHLEQLESRYLLAGDFGGTTDQPPPEAPAPITWFETFDNVPRIEFESLGAVDAVYPDGFQGPRELAAGEWILQLSDSVAGRVHVLQTADQHLDGGTIDFTIIAGLGAEGLILVRGEGVTAADIEASLERNEAVESFSLNSVITGQATAPNDSDYTPGLLAGLTTIGAEAAWDESTGSMQTVVGVVDSGIDLDHPDLYLNIWLNQGEIPATFKDDLVDVDGDGLITFYDLNNLYVMDGAIYVASTVVLDGNNNFVSGDLATESQLTTVTPYAEGANAAFVRDLAGDRASVNGRIDPVDVLFDPLWSDGRDTDQNGFFDDFFGVNLRSGGEDPFAPNQPDDALGHGTHVAGTIGAVGNNFTGVVGINWQTSLMPLRILDNNNRSDAGAGLRAVNYAKMMRQRHKVDANNRTVEGANVRVLNNSWGQPGGYEPAFETAIGELGDEGILFVAAAGNGDIFGNGVDNDQTPFYPASYDVDNVIAVAASTLADGLATFSNYGRTSVDIAAPGTGIRSTLKGGGYGTANGTSMATPHVAGAAALIWSSQPQAAVGEIRAALLDAASVKPLENGDPLVSSGGRLSASGAIAADVFAPSARVTQKQSIATSGGTSTEFTVRYSHRDGIDLDSIDDNDVIVTRQWGPAAPIPVTYKPGSKAATTDGAIATYVMEAPGGGSFTSTTQAVIESETPNTVSSQIWVDELSGLPAALTVTVSARHSSAADLTLTLIAPDGARATLVSGRGGSGDDFFATTFDESADTSIVEAAAPFTGTFRPEQSLSSLLTPNVNGAWTLEIEDAASTNGGLLENWTLDFSPQWDPLDYGEYQILTVAGQVDTATSGVSTESRLAGSFDVRITDDPTIIYVDSFVDSLGVGSLRNAILNANAAAPAERTIILDRGTYTIDLPPVVVPDSAFGTAVETLGLTNPGGWSSAETGDFDVTGNLKIIGGTNDMTIIDAQGLNRIFKLHSEGRLSLERLTIQGGVSPASQGGAGVLSLGDLHLDRVIARENAVENGQAFDPTWGGAIAAWSGNASLHQAWLTENQADFGGGVFYGEAAGGAIQRSTFDNNEGGGVHAHVGISRRIENSTFSANRGGLAVIATVPRDGILNANGNSDSPSISDDGRYAAFYSVASNLVSGDTNGTGDVFVYDRIEGMIERVSIAADGTDGNSVSFGPSISGDGRFVAFASLASNLVPGDTNDVRDVFVYDRIERSIERVSVDGNATQGNGNSFSPSISGDGRFVAFESEANNLAQGDTNGRRDTFVYDRVEAKIERVSFAVDGTAGNGDSWSSSISDDGRYVAFNSDASNLVAGDTNERYDIFVYDRTEGTTEHVSIGSNGAEGNGDSLGPSISDDGRFVAFDSAASNLVPGDTNGSSDVFVYDRTEGVTERVSISSDSTEGNLGSWNPFISGDGQVVAFESGASNLIPSDTNGTNDIFIYDRTAREIERVSIGSEATEGNNVSLLPSVSGDGRFVAFSSRASNLVPGDTNGTGDIFVKDRVADVTQALTFNTPAISERMSDVSHVTIAHSGVTGSNHSIVGDIRVANTLFSLNNVTADLDARSALQSSQNILSTSPNSDFIAPLARSAPDPPVHALVLGNPAIDLAITSTNTTLDQLGQARLLSPDAGAVEATNASMVGSVYVDKNQNGVRDAGEEGIPDFDVQLVTPQTSEFIGPDSEGKIEMDGLEPGKYSISVNIDSSRPWSAFVPLIDLVQTGAVQSNGESKGVDLSPDGRFMAFESDASNLVTSDTNGQTDIFVYDRTAGTIERVSLGDDGTEGNDFSFRPSISSDGRFVAFESRASNLVPGDTSSTNDIFVYDRTLDTIERVGGGGRPSISKDARYVAFESGASSLVPGDTNGTSDVLVYDRVQRTFERVSIADDGSEGNDASWNPSVSSDGRFVAFESNASNLVPGDTNGVGDVFVYDRIENKIGRVSIGNDGAEGNGRSSAPSISADGRFIGFGSTASNLVPGDTNAASDGFIYDREEGTLERIGIDNNAAQGNAWTYAPSISGDGRFVAFASFANNLVPDDTNSTGDIFVYDRSERATKRVSLGGSAAEGNGFSFAPSISSDGRYVAFESDATNLIPGDTNGKTDVFLAFNPLASPATTVSLSAGEILGGLDLGVVPDPGNISGRIFQDVVANGVYDLGEPVELDSVVFLDLNFNRQIDEAEPVASPDANGLYVFSDIDSYVSYSIVATLPIGFEQVAPSASDDFAWNVFLPAGGTITNRDFAFRRVQATGQSTSSAVSGRLFEDKNANGVFDDGIDVPHGQIPVYLDGNNNRRHNIGSDEPITITGADGTFSIDGLSSRIVTLRTSLGDAFVNTTPLGNSFDLQTSSLFSGVTAFDTASHAAHADFNGDGFEDLAVLVSDGNLLAIRLNDQQGGFAVSELNIPLGETETLPGTSLPLEMVVGQFNGDAAGKQDVAIVGGSAGNVLILLDYDKDTQQFASRQAVDIGDNPVSLTAGFFDAGTTLDLAVLNSGTSQLVQASPPIYAKVNETFQILTNDGNGAFTAQPAVPVPGDDPVAIVSDDFNGDDNVDLAVLHKSPSLPDTPFGDVALFTGNGVGVFALSHIEPVEGGPLEMVSGDFNLDGIADLAVANVAQNTLSILSGRTDGAVIRETAHPIGTGERGIDSMDVADIDNDGDLDIVATRLSDGGVAIFRNITDTSTNPVVVQFEPLDSFGVGQASIFERAPIVLANFDNDASGPNGEGTIDIIAIPKSTATVNVLLNTLVDGGHRVALDGLNSISDLDFIITPTGDVVPPSVTDVRIAGSGWATSFRSAVDPQNLRGVEVPGPTALRPLSWNGLNTLFVEFSEDIQKTGGGSIDAADLTLTGVNVPDYETAPGFGITASYSDGGGDGPFLLTIQLAGAVDFAADRVVLGIGGTIVDLAGNPLGGNSIFGFNVLPGDVDGSGGVLATDVLTVNASQFTFAGAVGYDAFRDIDGSGAVFANDVLLTNGRQFTFLPPEPSPPAEGEDPVSLMLEGTGESEGLRGCAADEFNLPGQASLTTQASPVNTGSPRPASGKVSGGGGLSAHALETGFAAPSPRLPPHPQPFSPTRPGENGASLRSADANAQGEGEVQNDTGSPGEKRARLGSVDANAQGEGGVQNNTTSPGEKGASLEGAGTGSVDTFFGLTASQAEGEDVGAAGVKLFGEIETFNGPGTYTLDMFVQAVGGPVSIAGFNAPLLVEGIGVSFAGDDTAFAPNASFDLEFITGLGTPGVYGVAGSLGPGLQLDAGQSEILFSVDLVVDSNFVTAADVVSIITEGPFASALQFTDADLATIQDVTIESAARITVPVPPVVLLNSLSTDPADLPQGAQPSSWDTQRDQIRDIAIELQTSITALPAGGITLRNLGAKDGDPETVMELRVDQVSLDTAGTMITILLDANQLPDGRYKLELSPDVTSGSAFAFIADDQNRFFVLRGDWDGNSSVDLRDLATFAYWLGIPGGVPDYVNDDGIGGITIDDLARFEANYAVKFDVPGMTESIDPDWIDAEALQRAKATITERTDVNGSGMVSPLDALNVINRIASGFVGTTDWQYDVNRDAEITPRDALFVINAIARASLSDQNPGEASPAESPTESLSDAATVVLDLVGGRQTYSGPGSYTFDFTITAIGGDQTIAGFNLPLRFDVPGVTFGGTTDDFIRNPAFSYDFVAPLSQANHFGVAASGATGLALAQGQTAVLFSIVVDVSASVEVVSELEIAIPITDGTDAQGLQFIGSGIQVIEPPNFLRGAILAPPGPRIELTGEVEEFTGAGTYALEFSAQAIGGPISIAGFNVPMIVDVPGVSFSGDANAFTPNSSFINKFVTALASPNSYGVAASLGTGIELNDGEREVLFSMELSVDSSAAIDSVAEVAKIITSGALANSLQMVDPQADPIADVSVASPAILARAIVPQVTINDGSSTRSQVTSLTVRFDTPVDQLALASAFRLTNLDTGLPVETIHVQATDQAGQTIATLTFDGAATHSRAGAGALGNSLADGNYRLDIFSDHVNAANGQQLFRDQQVGESPVDRLFRLYGDTDGDRDVDGQDYGRFGLSFLQPQGDPSFDPFLDFDGDGDVDGQDHGSFSHRFLKRLG